MRRSTVAYMEISLIDNAVALKDPDGYEEVRIDVAKALKSLQLSFFAHEVMHKDGSLKSDEDLSEKIATRRGEMRERIAFGEDFQKPVAGIGINDNFELGAGRDLFVLLAMEGWREIPVHIRKKQRKELRKFIIE